MKKMADLLEDRPEPLPGCIRVEFTSPGGLAVRAFADGAALMRVCLGHPDAEDGLVAEMRSGAEPAPWASAAARDEAMASIRSAGWIDDTLRAELLGHVEATPWYE